jgi:nucleoside-diphosphate-sugar epimerase
MSDRRIVVLGATGFVGSYVTQHAILAGWKVLPIGSGDIDLRAAVAAHDLAGRLSPEDVVVHSAAVAPTKTAEDVITNLGMTQSVVEALKQRPVGHLIVVSSDAVYGTASGVVDENSPCNADSLHGVMSLGREILCAESGTPSLTIVRPAPIYGVGDTHNSYGPNRFARQAIESGQISVFGAGASTRDHVAVDDVAAVIMRCAIECSDGIVNVSSGVSVSFADLAGMVAVAANSDTRVVGVGSESTPTFRSFDITGLVRRFPDLVPVGPNRGVERMLEAMRGSGV